MGGAFEKLIVQERECLELREEIEHLSQKQEVLATLKARCVCRKSLLKSSRSRFSRDLKELEEQKTKRSIGARET